MNKELHYKYIISYLLAAIVLLISLAYFDVPQLVDKFSFALTLSSLLLSVLAIFYSIIASNKQDEQFVKVIEANGKLKSSVEDIQSASNLISRLANDIPEHFNRLDGKLTDLSSAYSSMANENISNAEPSKSAPNDEIELAQLRKMVFQLQFAGMAVLYAFIVSSMKSKPLNLDSFQEIDVDVSYAIGILNGFQTTGLIDFTIHEEAIISKFCNSALSKQYKMIIDAVIKTVNKEASVRLEDRLEVIDNIYAK